MKEAITDGVSIKVAVQYRLESSQPEQRIFVFSYDVFIENQNDFSIKLLSRYWRITDSFGNVKEVEGDGVVGQQPVIMPQKAHEYSSWCPIPTELGSMEGYYLMERSIDKSQFKVYIPKFILTEHSLLN